mmetsp:Transcript_96467/g.118225  ORF Transcript_96467/g.118225 Transcript_96467/m.118225 type:complete len:250 (-) Transcript_96467:104-853(-)
MAVTMDFTEQDLNKLSISLTSNNDDDSKSDDYSNSNDSNDTNIKNDDDIKTLTPECCNIIPESLKRKHNMTLRDFKSKGLGEYCHGLCNYEISQRIGIAFDKEFGFIGTTVIVWDADMKYNPGYSGRYENDYIRREKNVKGKSIIIYRQRCTNQSNYNYNKCSSIPYDYFRKYAYNICSQYNGTNTIRLKMEQILGKNVSVIKGQKQVSVYSNYSDPYYFRYPINDSNKKNIEYITLWQHCTRQNIKTL